MPSYRNATSGTISANDTSVTLAYREFTNGGVGVQITGTFSATLQFEMSIDGTNFVAIIAESVTTGTQATTTTATGIFKFDVVGARIVRVRSTAYTSGTATVSLTCLAG